MELTYPHELIKITENLTSAEETSDKQLKDLISFLSYMSKGKNKQMLKIINEMTYDNTALKQLKSNKELDFNLGLKWLVDISILIIAAGIKIKLPKIKTKELAESIICLVNHDTKDEYDAKEKLSKIYDLKEKIDFKEMNSESLIFLLYFIYSNEYPLYKKEFLEMHYKIVRNVAKKYEPLYTWFKNKGDEKLTDEYLSGLVITSIALYGCGYNQSIRLPKLEETNYTENVIKNDSIIKLVSEAYDDTINEIYTEKKTTWSVDTILFAIFSLLRIKKAYKLVAFDVMASIMIIGFTISYYMKSTDLTYLFIVMSIFFIVISILGEIRLKESLLTHLRK